MKKIKEILIHWLGGYTEDEYVKDTCDSFDDGLKEGKRIESNNIEGERLELINKKEAYYRLGYKDARLSIMGYANSLYGLNAEDWCKKMYDYLSKIKNEDL